MEKRQFGDSDLKVTPIGLGLAALGRPGYINLGHADDLGKEYSVAAMEAHSSDVLDAAWDAGIRYFDAARSYGRAESFLGNWLRRRSINPSSVTVGSKWGYTYTAGWQVDAPVHELKEHSLAVLQRQVGESRSLLGDYLNLYQIHSATLDSGVLDNGAVLKELFNLKQSGLKIGLSLSGMGQSKTLRRALSIKVDSRLLFDAVQATWNLLEPSAGPALSEANEAGLGIIVKEAVANGRLTPRNHDPAFQPKRLLLENMASELDTTVDSLALAAVLARPWVDIVLSGAATVEHLLSNVKAIEISWSPEFNGQLESLVEPPEIYWSTRSRLAWN